MKYSLLTYWNLGFGLLLIIQAYALYFMKLHVSQEVIQLTSLATLGLTLIVIATSTIKKSVKPIDAKISLDN